MVASQLYSTVQDDGNYYDRRHETMPLKGNLVRLHQRNVKDFVHFMLQLAPYSLSVTGCLAQGGHARVYKAKSLDNTTCALKIQSPAHAYEYCVMKRLVLTLGSTYTQNMVQPMSFHHFRDASCLVMEYCPQGTLLGAINKVRLHATQIGTKTVQGLAEPVVMFLAVRLLQGVVAMHRSGFVHGDIKADNMMLNIQSAPKPKSTKSTATSYTGHDDEYWSLQQVKFIDFGRALDLSAYPSGQKFIAGWQTNKNDDPPQALDHGEWEPWILDYWGLAKVMHCLLFGLHMEVILAGTQNSIRQPMRRWWHTNVWSKLFSVLLNPGRHLPITGTLVDIQHEMEDILVERERNHEKPLSIMISALESMIKE
ncbi:protein kinase [Umbelopsis nana]